MNKVNMNNSRMQQTILATLLTTTIISGLVLSSSIVSADDIVDNVSITVSESCTISGNGMNSHSAEINNGTYNSSIGETTIKAFCNDNEGFAIYAVGFTDNEPGKNVLSNSTLGSAYDIPTGALTSGNTSQWAMKLTATSGTYIPIIAGSSSDTEKEQGDPDYTSFQQVPSRYAKVAYKTSGTDVGTNAEGSTLKTTYQAYISPTQPAGTYTGQVKYTMVHPNDHTAPVTHPAVLDTGKTVNAKLKSLAATVVNGEETTITPTYNLFDTHDNYVKSISVHLETPAPAGFIPTEKNTISAPSSNKAIYIVFDNANDAGTMHFYTEGERIVLPADSSYMFYYFSDLVNLSDISDWDSSNVIDMNNMFWDTGSNSVAVFTLDLSAWNTSNVIDMHRMFSGIGHDATTFSLDLSSWNTSSVTDMSGMFLLAGYSATTFSLDLSSWNTANVTSMNGMFEHAGENAITEYYQRHRHGLHVLFYRQECHLIFSRPFQLEYC